MTNIDQPTAEEINNTFKAAGDSVDLINGIVAGTKMVNEDPEDKIDTVKRNVEHLEIQIFKDWYISDSVSRTAPASKDAIQSAITSGKSYLNI
jgi:hypothetical protein